MVGGEGYVAEALGAPAREHDRALAPGVGGHGLPCKGG